MPDTLTLSTGVSLGLLAGVVSGVCYMVANGLSWPKNERETRRCVTSTSEDGACADCGGERCGGLVPCICHTQQDYRPVKFESGAWFLRQVQRAASLMPWSLSTDRLEQIAEEDTSTSRELRTIREFLETLSAKLAGGALEGTRVTPLYDHPAYLPQSRDGASSASSGRPSTGASNAHASLKRLVARVVEEAAALPALAQYSRDPDQSAIDSTYEDLLASAILNKVIYRYQQENGSGGRSSGIHSASASPTPSERSSPRSLTSRHARDITPPLREEDDISDWEDRGDALELPKRTPFPDFRNDVIRENDNETRDFDEVSGSELSPIDGSWEENWLFQKKKIKTMQSVPVPMLVPNSNAEYRAMIGDRDADDTTDLSDNASEADDEELEFKSDMKRALEFKHEIGGKIKIEDDFEPDSLTEVGFEGHDDSGEDEYNMNNQPVVAIVHNESDEDNIDRVDGSVSLKVNNENEPVLILGIDSGPLPKAEFTLKEEIHRTLLNGNVVEYKESDVKANGDVYPEEDKYLTMNGSSNTLSRHQKEGEYEETVTLPVQRYADSLRRKHFDDVPHEVPTRDTDPEEELIPGSIAYRERKKWLNYVEMPNNPYSPEAIQKRLSAKNTSNLFDMLTSKNSDLDNEDLMNEHCDVNQANEDIKTKNENLTQKTIDHVDNKDKIDINVKLTESQSPKILKDVLAEEVPEFKRYGRDYYIKEAKTSSGGRKKNTLSNASSLSSMNKSTSLDNFETEFASPGLLIQQFNTIAENQQYTKFSGENIPRESITITPNNKTQILIEYDDDIETIFSAKPAIVEDDTDEKFDEILQAAFNTVTIPKIEIELEPKSPTSVDESYVSSSSLDDSIKIYNVQTGEILKSKPVDKVSSRYVMPDRNDNIDIADNNISKDSVSQNGDLEEEPIVIVDGCESETEDFDHMSEVEEILSQMPKVKELAKKFVSMDNLNEPIKPRKHIQWQKSRENLYNEKSEKSSTKQYMHSLTARSISREFREELKLSMATPLTVPGGTKEVPNGIEEITKESSRPGSPLPEPGTIKNKLAFFESLKSKFSTK